MDKSQTKILWGFKNCVARELCEGSFADGRPMNRSFLNDCLERVGDELVEQKVRGAHR
jgi:hypothetical protein